MALSGSLNFLSASELGSFMKVNPGTGQELFRVYVTKGTLNPANAATYPDKFFIPNDFVGLNTNIYEPITASTNILGYPSTFLPSTQAASLSWDYTRNEIIYDNVAGDVEAYMLNGILHHRNGPYQHPSWKQIRGGEHPVARSLRLNNTMSFDIHNPVMTMNAIKREKQRQIRREFLENSTLDIINKSFLEQNKLQIAKSKLVEIGKITLGPTIKRFYEPSVVIKHRPLVYDFTSQGIFGTNAGKARSSLTNNMVFFENTSLNDKMNILGPIRSGEDQYGYEIKDGRSEVVPNRSSHQDRGHQYYGLFETAKIIGATNFIYSQMIFPKSVNVFRPFKLGRSDYEETPGLTVNGYDRTINRSFWRTKQAPTVTCEAAGYCYAFPYIVNDPPYSLLQTASSDGTTRLRTDGAALNSQEYIQRTNLRPDFIEGTINGHAEHAVSRQVQLIGTHFPPAGNSCGTSTCPAGPEANGSSAIPNTASFLWNVNTRFMQNGIIGSRGILTTTGSFSSSRLVITSDATNAANWDSSFFQLIDTSLNTFKMLFDDSTSTLVSVANLAPALVTVGTSGISTPGALAQQIVDAVNAPSIGNNWSGAFRAELLPGSATGQDRTIILRQNLAHASTLSPANLATIQGYPLAFDNVSGTDVFKVAEKFDDGNKDGGVPNVEPRGAFVNNETYSPHPISLLSMWPLDPRQDLLQTTFVRLDTFNSNFYPFLTSSHGGKGLQIGLSSHRMQEWHATAAAAAGVPAGAWPVHTNVPVRPTKAVVFGQTFDNFHVKAYDTAGQHGMDTWQTSSYLQLTHLMTGTAGELVYSTKPTIFYHAIQSRTAQETHYSTAGGANTNPAGYRSATASLQYNRHTFPYNTPFYISDKVRKRQPFFDSYAQFSHNLKYLSRDYSIVPEYRISDHIEYYHKKYFRAALDSNLYTDFEVQDNPTGPIIRKQLRNFQLIGHQPSRTKLDFLNIAGLPHGSGSSSSPYFTSFSGSSVSKQAFLFDTLENKVTDSEPEFFKEPIIHFSQASSSLEFFKKFSHTDDLIDFSQIVNKPFNNGKNTIPSKIKFVVKSLQKLLPYKNFYPVTKTVDVGNKFKGFIYDSIRAFQSAPTNIHSTMKSEFTGSLNYVHPGLMQTFLEPFFAPGILYNSIKSGIAVDYPIYTKNPAYFAPLQFLSGAVHRETGAGGSQLQHDMIASPEVIEGFNHHFKSFRFDKSISSSFNYGGFYMMGAMRGLPAILNRAPTHRLPFESLYNVNYLDFFRANPLFLTTDFLDLDINGPSSGAMSYNVVGDQAAHHPGAAYVDGCPAAVLDYSPSKRNDTKKDLYVSSINNYLCETMNFFLKDQGMPGVKLPVITSKRKAPDDMGFINGHTYYMEISLRMGVDHVSCEGPRDAGVGGGGIENNRYTNGSSSMRGYLYGPPIEIVQMSGSKTVTSFPSSWDPDSDTYSGMTEPYIASYREGTDSGILATANDAAGERHLNRVEGHFESYFGANLQDPAYQAYTPPYFYGASSIILSYKAENTTQPEVNLKPTVYDVVGEARQKSFYFEEYITGSLTSRGTGSSHDTLCKFVPGTSSIAGQGNVRMKIDSSIDIFGDQGAGANIATVYSKKGGGPDGNGGTTVTEHICYFAPKWVCPVLDFSSSFSAVTEYSVPNKDNPNINLSTTILTNSFHNAATGRGLWGGYGTDPYDLNAMSIVDDRSRPAGSDTTYEKGIYLSVKFPFYGEQTKQKSVSFQSDMQQASENGFYTTRLGDHENGNVALTGSLISELGFEEKNYQIGQFAEGKKISEALVIIPYFEKPFEILARSKTPLKVTDEIEGTTEEEESYDVPGGEIYRTREIIPGKHFLPIHKTLFDNLLSMNLVSRKQSVKDLIDNTNYIGFESNESYISARNTDVYRMIELLLGDEKLARLGYEIPPELDFVHYKQPPFQMCIIPMRHTLKKQELIDIYQGIMPDSSLRARKNKTEFTIKPGETSEIDFSWMPVIIDDDETVISMSSITPQNFMSPAAILEQQTGQLGGFMHESTSVWMKNSQDFYKNLKFMVFKVKERANKDYERYRKKQIARKLENAALQGAGNENKIDFDKEQIIDSNTKNSEIFGYNWPYDDFSLVESVKIDIDITVAD